jgi:hypothetical protein
VMASPTVSTPSVMKKAMAPRRRVMFIAWRKYSGELREGSEGRRRWACVSAVRTVTLSITVVWEK